MSMHKSGRNDTITPGASVNKDNYPTSGRKEDVTLADYIARKTKEPLTFEQWFAEYLGDEWEYWLDIYDMRAAWIASRENL